LANWILEAGYWKLDTGSWILEAGYWKLDTGSWILEAGSTISARFAASNLQPPASSF
jgi:hypothetical protein